MNPTNTNQYYDNIFKLLQAEDREAFREQFLKLHEQDQVELFHLLYPENKARIMHFLEAKEFAELFERLDFEDQAEALKYLSDDYLQAVFTYVADDDVADFIQELEDTEVQAQTLDLMKDDDRQVIEEILVYRQGTAGALLTTEMITLSKSDTAEAVIKKLQAIGRHAETIYYNYVVDEADRLVGVLSLRDLLFAEPTAKIEDVMNTQTVQVAASMDQEEVAQIIMEYDLLAVPVVDDHQVLLGIVTVDDIMDVVELEATEDFHRFAGISVGDEGVEEADTVLGMTKSRLPWILILIVLGLISANLIAIFEDTLSQVVALAAFMPIIMDSAGNVGTQSLAVSVRRITLGEEGSQTFWQMLRNEFFSGVLMGIASFFTIGIISYLLYGNLTLSLIIGFSLMVTLSISTVIGFLVPALFHKVGIDPAVASGPFITTINDTFGLLVYFSVATYLLHHL